jgi:hypothetical protein
MSFPQACQQRENSMTKSTKTLMLLAAALTAVAGLFWSGNLTLNTDSSLVTEAQAIIGRPLTPLSYAGVARRTVRRCAAGVYYC